MMMHYSQVAQGTISIISAYCLGPRQEIINGFKTSEKLFLIVTLVQKKRFVSSVCGKNQSTTVRLLWMKYN